MFKQVCLLTRKPGMPMDEFVDYYENAHAPLLAGMMPQARRYLRRYVQPESNPVSGTAPGIGFDCLMELWWDSRDAFEVCMVSLGEGDAFAKIRADEEKIFASHDNPVFSVDEVESEMRGYADDPALDGLRQCNGHDDILKLVFLLKRRPNMTMEQFRTYYESNHRLLGEMAMPGAQRYMRRYVQPEHNPITGEAIELPFDAVMEIWWDSRADWDDLQSRMTTSSLGVEIYEDEENLFASHANPVFTVLESDTPMRG